MLEGGSRATLQMTARGNALLPMNRWQHAEGTENTYYEYGEDTEINNCQLPWAETSLIGDRGRFDSNPL